jgi:hypothetical protein
MRSTGKLVLSALLLLLSFMAGCASVPMEADGLDTQAKTFNVPSDKSSIYVYRNETFGSAIRLTLALDGKVAGQSGPKTFFLFHVPPGHHEVSSISENTSSVDLDTAAGKAYYVWQEVKMGLFEPRTELHKMDDDAGRAGVLECKMAHSQI